MAYFKDAALTAPAGAEEKRGYAPRPAEAREGGIAGLMTAEEKMSLIIGADSWHTAAVSRLGIPALCLSDGPNGLRREDASSDPDDRHNRFNSFKATCFPTASALAATFNTGLLYRIGAQLASEAKGCGVNILLGPGINHKRSPAGGRNFEYFSEDPVLTAELASAYINGLQDIGVGCALKHFFANNTEFNRHEISIEIDETPLREIYLKSFERIINKAKPFSVMTAYNKFRGEYCSHSAKVIKELLRKELNFSGLVLSDWGAVHDRAEALKAGCDLEMGFNCGESLERLKKAYYSGGVAEADLNGAAEAVAQAALKLGAKTEAASDIDFDAGYALSLEAALEGMVLLKNDESFLPLKDSDFCVIGAAAKLPRFQGEGSSRVNCFKVTSPLGELEKLFGKAAYAEGYRYNEGTDDGLIRAAAELAAKHSKALIFIANDDYAEEESRDRKTLSLCEKHLKLIDAVSKSNPDTAVILQTGGVTEMPYINGVKAVLQQYFSGGAGGEAVAAVLSGRVSPSGRLAETFPVAYSENPSFPYYAYDRDNMEYKEGLMTGYRFYDRHPDKMLFRFGYGLSYAEFCYKDLSCSLSGNSLTISVTLKNESEITAAESTLIYVGKPSRAPDAPEKELLCFFKHTYAAYKETTTTVTLPVSELAGWDAAAHSWRVPEGGYTLYILSSGGAVIKSAQFEVNGIV